MKRLASGTDGRVRWFLAREDGEARALLTAMGLTSTGPRAGSSQIPLYGTTGERDAAIAHVLDWLGVYDGRRPKIHQAISDGLARLG